MAKTKKPSGLSIARDGWKFTCGWKIADEDYGGGLQFRWRSNQTKKGKWEAESNLNVKDTSRTVSLSASAFFPNTTKKLTTVTFEVRGKRAAVTKDNKTTTYDWSDWTTKNFTVSVPYTPTLTGELDSTVDNITRFSWETSTSTTASRMFTGIEWQTLRVRASKVTDGSKLSWKASAAGWYTGTSGAASGTINAAYTTEDTALLVNDSYTRWVRVRARGPAGVSAWRYAKHVYARPYTPTMNSVTATKSGVTTTVKVIWTAGTDAAHPIDSTTVEYLIATPESSLAPPAGGSWEEGAVIADTSAKDAVQFTIDDVPGIDECLWVRVVAHHDHASNDRPSAVKRAMVGTLAAPEIDSVTPNISTHRVTINVTHNSDVPDSRIAVVFRKANLQGKKLINDRVIGILGHSGTSGTFDCPTWEATDSIDIGIYEFQGSYDDTKGDSETVHKYAVSANMKSSTIWRGGDVPRSPTWFNGRTTETPGEVLLNWNYPWALANVAELSWSQNPNAWESTDEPSTYTVTNENAGRWRVSGLETGVTWYFRVRLGRDVDGEIAWGPYTDNVEVDLSTVPSTPVLTLSAPVVTRKDTVTASWGFESEDGSTQTYAEVREATVNGDTVTIGSLIAKATTAQHVTIKGSKWAAGTTHYLAVRVTSSGNRKSAYSDPVPITIAEPITCEITNTSLVTETITSDNGEQRSVISLKSMPLTATVTGAGAGGQTTLIIERSADYHMIRPDDTEYDGYAGETVALVRQDGEAQISVITDDLIGLLDDGAPYRLIATAEDSYGQTASDEIEFEVHWTHQAEVPSATVVVEDNVAKITPIAPEGAVEGDVCDIYRLSVDLPELIVQNGAFGETYVDPYPAIGENGGHRVVHRTLNGDYITEDDQPAWVDLGVDDGDLLNIDHGIIDFAGERITVDFNQVMDNSWEKDFQKTTYLGGSQQGDWNPGVSRSGTVSAVIATDDLETMQTIRRLAEYTGICHVRTQDGSSYAADVQVGDGLSYEKAGKILEYTLTITRVDPEGFDGLTLEQWEAEEE